MSERDESYIEAYLARFASTWREHPDSRFGQLVSNVAGDRPLMRTSDEQFLTALDEWDEAWEAQKAERARTPREPVERWIAEGARRTNEQYRAWALRTFGRVGRDPARIEPFLSRFAEAWAERPQVAFCELVRSVGGPNLRLVEEETFRFLLDNPDSISAEAIEASYTYRGPLGDLLREIESHGEGQP